MVYKAKLIQTIGIRKEISGRGYSNRLKCKARASEATKRAKKAEHREFYRPEDGEPRHRPSVFGGTEFSLKIRNSRQFVILAARWGDAEKVVPEAIARFRFPDHFPLERVGSHVFPYRVIRYRSAIVIDCGRSYERGNRRRNHDAILFRKIESSGIPLRKPPEQFRVIPVGIAGKTVAIEGLAQNVEKSREFFGFGSTDGHAGFFRQPDIVPPLLLHIGKDFFLGLTEIDTYREWFKIAFVRTRSNR